MATGTFGDTSLNSPLRKTAGKIRVIGFFSEGGG
jgi:hypothetical protein